MNYSTFDQDHSEYSSTFVFPDQNQEVSPLDNFMQANPQANTRESYPLKFHEEDSEMIFIEHDDDVPQGFSEKHGVRRQGCSQIPEEPADLIPHLFSRHGKPGQKTDSEIKLVSNFIKGYEELVQRSAEAFPEMQASGNPYFYESREDKEPELEAYVWISQNYGKRERDIQGQTKRISELK